LRRRSSSWRPSSKRPRVQTASELCSGQGGQGDQGGHQRAWASGAPASNNDSSDTESDGDAEGDEAPQGGSEGDAEELARKERQAQVAELLALLEAPAAP
jgi:hypothetical protein